MCRNVFGVVEVSGQGGVFRSLPFRLVLYDAGSLSCSCFCIRANSATLPLVMRRLIAFTFIGALLSCTSPDPRKLDEEIKRLRSTDSKVRNQAALAIAGYGENGAKAVPALIQVLRNDPSRGIRTSAAFALRKIGTKEAVAALDGYSEE